MPSSTVTSSRHQPPSEGFSKGKTIFVLAVVVGCFAVLWPKIFWPMFTASMFPGMGGGVGVTDDVCCDVISEKDTGALKLMSQLCRTIIIQEAASKPSATNQSLKQLERIQLRKPQANWCRGEILKECGVNVDVSVLLFEEKPVITKEYIQALNQLRSYNASYCLKMTYGVDVSQIGVSKVVNKELAALPSHMRPERQLRPGMMHPALLEKGRGIPASHPVYPHPRRTIEKEQRPGPQPGVRPPIAQAAHVPQSTKGSGTIGIVMPMYTIGIVCFFVYTLAKILFKKPPEDIPPPPIRASILKDSYGYPKYPAPTVGGAEDNSSYMKNGSSSDRSLREREAENLKKRQGPGQGGRGTYPEGPRLESSSSNATDEERSACSASTTASPPPIVTVQPPTPCTPPTTTTFGFVGDLSTTNGRTPDPLTLKGDLVMIEEIEDIDEIIEDTEVEIEILLPPKEWLEEYADGLAKEILKFKGIQLEPCIENENSNNTASASGKTATEPLTEIVTIRTTAEDDPIIPDEPEVPLTKTNDDDDNLKNGPSTHEGETKTKTGFQENEEKSKCGEIRENLQDSNLTLKLLSPEELSGYPTVLKYGEDLADVIIQEALKIVKLVGVGSKEKSKTRPKSAKDNKPKGSSKSKESSRPIITLADESESNKRKGSDPIRNTKGSVIDITPVALGESSSEGTSLTDSLGISYVIMPPDTPTTPGLKSKADLAKLVGTRGGVEIEEIQDVEDPQGQNQAYEAEGHPNPPRVIMLSDSTDSVVTVMELNLDLEKVKEEPKKVLNNSGGGESSQDNNAGNQVSLGNDENLKIQEPHKTNTEEYFAEMEKALNPNPCNRMRSTFTLSVEPRSGDRSPSPEPMDLEFESIDSVDMDLKLSFLEDYCGEDCEEGENEIINLELESSSDGPQREIETDFVPEAVPQSVPEVTPLMMTSPLRMSDLSVVVNSPETQTSTPTTTSVLDNETAKTAEISGDNNDGGATQDVLLTKPMVPQEVVKPEVKAPEKVQDEDPNNGYRDRDAIVKAVQGIIDVLDQQQSSKIETESEKISSSSSKPKESEEKAKEQEKVKSQAEIDLDDLLKEMGVGGGGSKKGESDKENEKPKVPAEKKEEDPSAPTKKKEDKEKEVKIQPPSQKDEGEEEMDVPMGEEEDEEEEAQPQLKRAPTPPKTVSKKSKHKHARSESPPPVPIILPAPPHIVTYATQLSQDIIRQSLATPGKSPQQPHPPERLSVLGIEETAEMESGEKWDDRTPTPTFRMATPPCPHRPPSPPEEIHSIFLEGPLPSAGQSVMVADSQVEVEGDLDGDEGDFEHVTAPIVLSGKVTLSVISGGGGADEVTDASSLSYDHKNKEAIRAEKELSNKRKGGGDKDRKTKDEDEDTASFLTAEAQEDTAGDISVMDDGLNEDLPRDEE